MVCLQGWSLHLGLNLAPGSELWPLGEMFTPMFIPRGKHSLLFGRQNRISHPGDNFTPRGQNSPQGDNFAPRGQSLPEGRS
jgi:hypothetical protein